MSDTLPEPYCRAHNDADCLYPDMFTADQMRDYASAAVAAVEAECFRLRAAYAYSEAHAARLLSERDSAVAAERERCAKIVDPGELSPWEARGGMDGVELMCDLAAAIRAET